MSIILDALKKAERERNPEPLQSRPPNFSPILSPSTEPDPDDKNKKKPPYLLLGLTLLALGVLFYLRLFHQPTSLKISTPLPAVANITQKSPDEIRNQALDNFKKGDLETSRTFWNQLTLLTPTDEAVYNNLGVVLKKMREKEEARDAYQKALSLNPQYPEALNNMGVLLMDEQSTNQAKELFNKAIQIKPDYAEPYFHLALIEESEGNNSQAISHYSTFLKCAPDLDDDTKNKINERIQTLQNR